MADKPKTRSAEAAAYLKRCDPALKLGAWIGGGGFGDVYELEGSEPAMVVKIMDTRCIVASDHVNAKVKHHRREVKKYLEDEAENMRLLGSCDRVMPLLNHYQFNPEDTDGNWSADSSACVMLLIMPKMIPLSRYVSGQPLDEKSAVQLLKDIGQALTACAQHQIVHYDVKPDNIFVTTEGGKPRFVLGDFGISRGNQVQKKLPVAPRGFSHYRAPELINGKPAEGSGSDIYSLGVTAYECLTRTYPYPQDVPVEGMGIRVIDSISQELFDIISMMLQRDPAQRYSHPQILNEALRHLPASGARRAQVKAYAPAVREMIMARDYARAVQAAEKGIANGEPSCTRLKALAVFSRDAHDPDRCEKARAALAEMCLNGDPTSIFMRGFFFGRENNLKLFVRDLREAAEENCIPACYLYGRALYYGDYGVICPQDTEQGLEYLCTAAEDDYYPALRVLQEIIKHHPDHILPTPLRKKLRRKYPKDESLEKNAWLMYL